jgi:sugar O-acyltransferase (sialic acid O-acetyltransferase NeuD family)
MKKKIAIFGAGGHATVLTNEINKFKDYEIVGYFVHDLNNLDINKNYKKKILQINKKNLLNLVKNSVSGIIAIGDNVLRKKIVEDIRSISRSFKWEKIISKDSIVSSTVTVGDGTIIMSGCVVNPYSKIKNHCLINTCSIIEHENIFEDYSSVGPGVITGGKVKVGKFSHLGMGSIVLERIKVGKNVLIGANSFVNRNCLANKIYYGSPLRFIKDR